MFGLLMKNLNELSPMFPRMPTNNWYAHNFLIGAFTGCRHSDYTRLNNRNIVGGMISYVSLKTKTHATVPLKPIVKELLTNLPKEEVSDPTFNNNIRNICRKAGITEAVKVFKAGKEVEGEKWEFCFKPHGTPEFCNQFVFTRCRFYTQ